MAKDWGLKITKPGEDTTTTDPTKMLLSSKYQMFKYHLDEEVSGTITAGDEDVTVSITHGLGYVPAFIPYSLYLDKMTIIPSMPYGIGFTAFLHSWADDDKVYFKFVYGDVYGIVNFSSVDWFQNFGGDSFHYVQIGKPSGGTAAQSAIAFDFINTSRATITNAEIYLKVYTKNETVGGRIKWRTHGVDEDDCNDFNNSNPMGKTKTSASVDKDIQTTAEVSVNGYVAWSVLGIVNEIKSRSGWSSLNGMSFLFNDNGSTDDNSFRTYSYSSSGNFLKVTYDDDMTIYYRGIVFKDQIAS